MDRSFAFHGVVEQFSGDACGLSGQRRALQERPHRCVALNSLSFVKGGWAKPPTEVTQVDIRQFGDAIDEINARGLDMRDFNPGLMPETERAKAYSGPPRELVQTLSLRLCAV